MLQTPFVSINGQLTKENKARIGINNRSFRYGDGFFETIKMVNGRILMAPYHLERLFASLETLQFEAPNFFIPAYVKQHIHAVAAANHHEALARIRVTIYRGDGGLYDPENHFPNMLIQSWPLNNSNNLLNDNGLVLDICNKVVKSCDDYSHLKSNNYLGYAMAALWAKNNRLNDAIVLNHWNRVSDATIANVFVVKEGLVTTPPLSEGGVNGNLRKHLLTEMRAANMPVQEAPISTNDLLQADEVFLTNAIYGIRWVKQIGTAIYSSCAIAAQLHQRFVQPLWLNA
jgi:branched-chain amino acid aminotransferase